METNQEPHERVEILEAFFLQRVFSISPTRIAYSWEEEEWSRFWEGLLEGAATDAPVFGGRITLRATKGMTIAGPVRRLFEVEIIEGGQQITTLSILLLALSRQGVGEVFETFIKQGLSYKLRMGFPSMHFYSGLVEGKAFKEQGEFGEEEGGRFYRAFDYFIERLSRVDIHEIISYLVERMYFVTRGFALHPAFPLSLEKAD